MWKITAFLPLLLTVNSLVLAKKTTEVDKEIIATENKVVPAMADIGVSSKADIVDPVKPDVEVAAKANMEVLDLGVGEADNTTDSPDESDTEVTDVLVESMDDVSVEEEEQNESDTSSNSTQKSNDAVSGVESSNEEELKKAHEDDADTDIYLDSDSDYDDRHRKVIQKPRAIVMRCSRRFTPGSCGDPVRSVWTYVFDEQNCTMESNDDFSERLGCMVEPRSNRFRTYNRCHRLCMHLSNIYSTVLDVEKDNKDPNKREFGLPLRRSNRILWNENNNIPNLPPLRKSESENEGRPVSREYYDYMERQKSFDYSDYSLVNGAEEFLVPPELDEFGVNPSVMDDFHNNFYV